jgi:hypothetical protein
MLSLRKGIRLAGSGAVAMAIGAGLLGAAHPASASLASPTVVPLCSVLSPPGQPASDSIKLLNVGGISFGSGGLDSSNNPACGSTVAWNIPPNTVQPSISGELYMKNSLGKTAHVRVTYFDIHGNIVTGQLSPDELATSNYQAFPITINRFNDPRFYRVAVSTEVKSGSSYVSLATASAYMGSATHPAKSCTIDANGEELGGTGGVMSGHPVSAAVCSWVVSPAAVQARVNGREYFENGLGRTARIVLSTYDVHGNWLGKFTVASNSPAANGVVGFPVLGSSASNDRIYRAQLAMQVLVGTSWQPVEQRGHLVHLDRPRRPRKGRYRPWPAPSRRRRRWLVNSEVAVS